MHIYTYTCSCAHMHVLAHVPTHAERMGVFLCCMRVCKQLSSFFMLCPLSMQYLPPSSTEARSLHQHLCISHAGRRWVLPDPVGSEPQPVTSGSENQSRLLLVKSRAWLPGHSRVAQGPFQTRMKEIRNDRVDREAR